jgi:eukaryotic-like serine/threonine-protein kinase
VSDARWDRIQTIFADALEFEGEERDVFLRDACAGDDALLADVASLLEADARDNSFLDGSTFAVADLLDDNLSDGATVGPYRIIRAIGEGGMGVVHLAERADGQFQQLVALKVIKRGMDSNEILARFRTERQILARLQHPNVARLLDGGVIDDGRPWFAMEFIQGKPIDEYCDAHRLTTDLRLDLFATVCEAVQYAHANLVVHRDLKPDNVLVTASGEVKLLDFGIAKVLGGDDDRRFTAVGARILTPAYASPEQRRGEPVNTSADVYSLGVMLYELLVGQRPPRTDTATESESAPNPDVPKRKLRGDLDVICRRALQDDPERRFASVEAMAADIRRHRTGQPVLARPDSFGYRAGKFISRHLAPVLSTAGVVLVVSALVGFYTVRLRAESARARLEAANSAGVADFLVNLFQRASPQSAKRLVTARDLIDAAVAGFDTLAAQPELYSNLLMSTGMVYRELGDLDAAEPQLRKLVRLNRTIFSAPAVLSIEAKSQLATTLQAEGKFVEAEQYFKSALAEARALAKPDHIAVAYCLNNLGKVRVEMAHYDSAEVPLREAAEIYRRDSHAVASGWYGVALRNLARTDRLAGYLQQSDSLFALSLPELRKAYSGKDPALGEGLYEYGELRIDLGDLKGARAPATEALAIRRYEYPDGHPTIGQSLTQLATIDRLTGKLGDARLELGEADSVLTKDLPPTHPWIAEAALERGALLEAEGRLGASEAAYREAIRRLSASLGADHPESALGKVRLAELLERRGNCGGAAPLLSEAVATLSTRLRPGHPWIVEAESALAKCPTAPLENNHTRPTAAG